MRSVIPLVILLAAACIVFVTIPSKETEVVEQVLTTQKVSTHGEEKTHRKKAATKKPAAKKTKGKEMKVNLSQALQKAIVRAAKASDRFGRKRHGRRLRRMWSRTHKKIRKWCHDITKGSSRHSRTALYPMAGFDLMWIHACFPHAKRYVMLGQQPSLPGRHPSEILPATVRALRGFVKNNYLTTYDQNKSRADAARFFVIILKVLYRAKIRRIQPCVRGTSACVSITFRMPGARRTQEIRYWGGNVMSRASHSFAKPFFKDMRSMAHAATFFKAAEYDLFARKCKNGKNTKSHLFSSLISLVLRGSDVIISDDSGLPFELIAPSRWHRGVYGAYSGPSYMRDTCSFYQPALAKFYKEQGKSHSLPVTPFGYGMDMACDKLSFTHNGPLMVNVAGKLSKDSCMYTDAKCEGRRCRKMPPNPVCRSGPAAEAYRSAYHKCPFSSGGRKYVAVVALKRN